MNREALTKVLPILALSLLSACATCREHPVACSVVAGVVITSVAISAGGAHHAGQPMRTTQPVTCASNPASCQ